MNNSMMIEPNLIHDLQRSATFVIELVLANVLFWHPFPKKSYHILRLIGCAAVLVISNTFMFYWTGLSIFNHIISFAFSLIYLFIVSRFCYKIQWGDAAFCTIAGYNTQFIASIISELFQRLFSLSRIMIEPPILIIIYYIIYMLLGRQLRPGQNLNLKKIITYALLTSVVLVDIIFCANLRAYWMNPSNKSLILCTMIPLLICAVTALILQFTILNRNTLANELLIVNQLLRKEKAQYKFSRETIDAINRKCHDMRHQIRSIGSQEHINPEAIREMTKSIDIYDILYKTGNQALDTILAEKALYCQEHNISITCIADGQSTSIMTDTDIYSLFGNILENAIHAVSELPDEDRDILLTVSTKGELLSIHSQNAYFGVVEIQDGLPVTKNPDTFNHGIGTRSIQLVVSKYGGYVSFDAKDGIFYVDILIPLK